MPRTNKGTNLRTNLAVVFLVAFGLAAVFPAGCGSSETDSGASSKTAEGAAEGRSGPPTVPFAAEWIENSLAEHDRVLYVYKDFGDGVNHFTQKAWMGDNFRKIPVMREDSVGRDGTTGLACEIFFKDHAWGGFMFLNGVLKAGSVKPEPDFGQVDSGLDLTGADKLTFYARGDEGGEHVEFFAGGLGHVGFLTPPFPDSTKRTLGYVALTKEWRRYEIPLTGQDLSRLGAGFGWATNGMNNRYREHVRFYLDDIRFEFPNGEARPTFLTSYAPARPGTDGAIINDAAYLRDNALAIMALTRAGKHERARQAADAIVYALYNDRFHDDGRLRNAYSGGRPESFPGWLSAKGEPFARLPGFYDPEANGFFEDYHAVGVSTGNLSWAILALLDVALHAPESDGYLAAAQKIADFVLTLEAYPFGFAGGYEGRENQEIKVGYLSTEHNVDLMPVFTRLHNLAGKEEYKKAADGARSFVLSMHEPEAGFFYAGVGPDGRTVNLGVVPLDCQTWSLLALGKNVVDEAKVISYLEEHMAVDYGYDFDGDSKDGVWNEGAAQVGVLYGQFGQPEALKRILDALEARRLSDGSLAAADRDGVGAGFMVSGTSIPWNYDNRRHLGATARLSFLQQDGFNPLAVR
ncbi:MAG: hypothetical protein LBJ64_07030 [Deltaproteobacteria bacterium]|nr:hypothetical protein [Deltaproteobacteria bacterium]